MSEANRDAAKQYLDRANRSFKAGDLDAAKKAATRSNVLYPTKEAAAMLKNIEGAKNAPRPPPTSTKTAAQKPTSQTRQRPAASDKTVDKRKVSQAQIDITLKILRTKNLYERLGVNRDSPEKDIKRAFLKMSVKVHPDKNPAPKSADAFKAINNACDILCDDSKRRIYDQTGEENAGAARLQANPFNGFGRRGGGGNDPAEELLRQFFQGGFQAPGQTHFTYNFGGNHRQRQQQQQQRRQDGGQQQQQQQQQPEPMASNLMWLLIMFLAISFLWSDDGTSANRFSLYRTNEYSTKRFMGNKVLDDGSRIEFYVRADVDKKLDKDTRVRSLMEESVFTEYWQGVHRKCSHQGHHASCAKKERYKVWADDLRQKQRRRRH